VGNSSAFEKIQSDPATAALSPKVGISRINLSSKQLFQTRIIAGTSRLAVLAPARRPGCVLVPWQIQAAVGEAQYFVNESFPRISGATQRCPSHRAGAPHLSIIARSNSIPPIALRIRPASAGLIASAERADHQKLLATPANQEVRFPHDPVQSLSISTSMRLRVVAC